MAKLDIQPVKSYWEDDLDIQPLDIQPIQEEAPLTDRLKSGVKRSWEGLKNTADVGITMPAAGFAGIFGQEKDQEELFRALNERIAARDKEAQSGAGAVEPGFAGKLAGVITTLPGQIAAMPVSGIETAKQFIDQGESLGRAYAAGGLDTAGNLAGLALPSVIQGGKLMRAVSGGGINAAQDTATRAAISSIAETQGAKDLFAPTLETAGLAAIPGAGLGLLTGKPKTQKAPTPKKDIGAIVASEAQGDVPAGFKAGEFAGEVNMELFRKNQAEAELRMQQEFADRMEAQRVMEAEQYAAQQFPEQSTTGLSTGEGVAGGKVINRQPVTDSGLMGLPAGEAPRPVGLSTGEGLPSVRDPSRPQGPSNLMGLPEGPRIAPVGLSVGENTPGGAVINRPAGPSNLMGEPIPPVAAPVGLSTGEGVPGGRIIQRTPETSSGVMGVEPRPFDPFGSAGAGRFRQGGSAPIIGDLAQGIVRLGAGVKGMFTGVSSETPDTLTTPRSAENIAAKAKQRAKANAVGLNNSVYQNITTVEEALANLPDKDIGSNQSLRSGNEAIIRTNKTNGPLKFVRWLRTKAQTNTDALTAKYITGKNGFNETFRKLSDAEKMEVHEVIQELSKQRVDYSKTLADKLELTPAQRAFMEARGKALRAVLETANTVNKGLGFELIKALPGYSPGMFASTYVSLVGKYVGEGKQKRWVTEAVVNANSKWEYQQGLEYYKKQGKETINLDRRGLNTATKGGRNFDGTMKLLAALAEHDSRFAEAKGILDGFLKDQTKKLYNFDVHEMRKKGVEGNIGNKPWLDAKTNAKEALEAEVNYIDEAFKYWNYQEMLNKTKQLVDDPKMESYPNTRKYLDKYVKQVTGNNLHPIGAGVNSLVDTVFEAIGKGGAKLGLNIPENPNRVFAGAREFGSALMMNIYNAGFAGVQLLQMFQSGIPEAMKIRNEMGLSPDAPITSLAKSMGMRSWFAAMHSLGKFDEIPDSPMKDAYKWMREHGIDHYNEIQMSHEAAQNPKWTKTKNALFWPTRLPEMITRPTVFMWYADMFHQAGLRGEELHYTAKNATDYAMVNYHTDERPMVYQQLGVVGQSVGALRTYVHNAAEQMISRTKEAKQNPGAFLAMLGFTGALMGVAGLPFYDEIDQWFIQPVTKRSARDWMSGALHPALINGVASQYTGIDLQSRFSMADMIPGNPAEALAGPQLSRMFQILDSGFGYIKNQDTKSFNELAKAIIPSGAYGAYEEANLVDEQGFVLDKEGQVKYTEPRSEKERNVRKVLGLRPLRERLEDEDLYTTKKLEQRMTDKQRDAYSRMRAGLNLNDMGGFENAKQDYLDNEGDPKAIAQLIKRNAKESQLSARQRVIVAPGKSVGSVNKYNRYWED